MADRAAIRVESLTKLFATRTGFEDLTFEVAPGEVFGFLGPNGAGKTTTVRVLGTLLSATSGSAEVAGVPVRRENGEEIRRWISVVTETPGLYLKLSVYENLEYFAGLYGLGTAAARQRIIEALHSVDLAERRDDLAAGLSKGLRQRVGLARALLNDPKVMFLDEPTQGLDPEATRDVRELIERLRDRGVTIFLTTHRLEEAERLCDRVAILNTRLLSVGSPDDLRRRMFASSLEVRVASPLADPASLFAGLAGVSGWSGEDGRYVINVTDPQVAAPAVARALVGAGADVLHLAEMEHSLEDVYLELVGNEEG